MFPLPYKSLTTPHFKHITTHSDIKPLTSFTQITQEAFCVKNTFPQTICVTPPDFPASWVFTCLALWRNFFSADGIKTTKTLHIGNSCVIRYSQTAPYKWEGLRSSLALNLPEDEGNTPIPRSKWSNIIGASPVVQDVYVTFNNFTSHKVPTFHFCNFSLQTGFQELLTPNQALLFFYSLLLNICVCLLAHHWIITRSGWKKQSVLINSKHPRQTSIIVVSF